MYAGYLMSDICSRTSSTWTKCKESTHRLLIPRHLTHAKRSREYVKEHSQDVYEYTYENGRRYASTKLGRKLPYPILPYPTLLCVDGKERRSLSGVIDYFMSVFSSAGKCQSAQTKRPD